MTTLAQVTEPSHGLAATDLHTAKETYCTELLFCYVNAAFECH